MCGRVFLRLALALTFSIRKLGGLVQVLYFSHLVNSATRLCREELLTSISCHIGKFLAWEVLTFEAQAVDAVYTGKSGLHIVRPCGHQRC